MKTVGAIVLAAGRSRRMGAQKLLLPLGTQPLIAHILDQVVRSTTDAVSIVVGEDASRLAEALGQRPVRWIRNPDAEGDMLSSVRCGLRLLPPEWSGIMVVLGDQPGVTTESIDALLHAFRASDCGIVVPTFRGRRGHPLIFARRYVTEILERFDNVGLRGLLEAHAAEVVELALPTHAILEDMDDPAAYHRWQSRFAARQS